MKPIACWHHSNEQRLHRHLKLNRIDLYGPNEVTDKGTNRLNHWWGKMHLKNGDRIRIVLGHRIVAFATIDGVPEDLPQNEVYDIWGSFVKLRDIEYQIPPLQVASCAHLQASHRFDGPKTSLLAR